MEGERRDGEDFVVTRVDVDVGVGVWTVGGVWTDQAGERGVSRGERRVLRGGVRDGRTRRRGTDEREERVGGGGGVREVERGVRAGVSGVLGGALRRRESGGGETRESFRTESAVNVDAKARDGVRTREGWV